MKIRLNGRLEALEGAGTLSGLVAQRALTAEMIVIEHNGRIVPREEWASAPIAENDEVEIISFAGGG